MILFLFTDISLHILSKDRYYLPGKYQISGIIIKGNKMIYKQLSYVTRVFNKNDMFGKNPVYQYSCK